MKFGIQLPQGSMMELAGIADPVAAYEQMTRLAQLAEGTGYESVWLVDHVHTLPQPSSQAPLFEAWTSTSALARDTKRIRIGQLVTGNSYRNPALLAKMASTVDVLSHGRLTVGLGAGWFEPEYRAYGYPYPDAPVRLRQLGEAVQIILKMWTEDEATFEGTYYQVRGAINQPKGVQKPHIPLLIGGGGEQVTLKLVARYGDACSLTKCDFATLEHKLAVLKRHCEAVGRDYRSIHRTATALCVIGETDEQALAKVPASQRVWQGDALSAALVGSLQTIRSRLATYEALGVQELVLLFFDPDTIQRFAKEFIA